MTSPYAPPQAELSESFSAGGHTYRAQDGKVRLLSLALIIYGCVAAAGVVSDLVELDLLYSLHSGVQISDGDADASDMRQGMIGIAQVLTYLTTAIIFGSFIYRANANARALGGVLSVTPGWSVGYYFVPILNLYRPYQAFKEIWIHSDPDRERLGVDPSTAILGLWWGLWLISNIAGQAVARTSINNDNVAQMINASYLQIASDFLEIPLTLVALKVVRDLQAMQLRKRELAGRRSDLPADA